MEIVNMLNSAFPDNQFNIEEMIAEGDKVILKGTMTGTHLGNFRGIPPTGKSFSWRQIHILRITDGKIAEHDAVRDDLTLLIQLGVLPDPFKDPTPA